ncbi:MAG: hypothetical protein WB622_20880, partial [Acidobacteriaceae bacterium]
PVQHVSTTSCLRRSVFNQVGTIETTLRRFDSTEPEELTPHAIPLFLSTIARPSAGPRRTSGRRTSEQC